MTGRHCRRTSTGFLLLDLLVSVVIILILHTMFIGGPRKEARQKKDEAIEFVEETAPQALAAYLRDTGSLPTSEQGLEALVNPPAGVEGWRGPYLESIPLDPWGRRYTYANPGTHNRDGYDLASQGPNGMHGGRDDVANYMPGAL